MKTLFVALLVAFIVSDIELESRSLLDGKIEILVPKDFKDMPEEYVKVKYPGKNRPKLILTDEETTTNLAFSLLEAPADASMIPDYQKKIAGTYKSRFTSAKWLKEGVMDVNGKKVGYFKFITEGADQKIYNFIFLTDVNEKLMIGTFNCVEKDLEKWQGTADKIVQSLKVK